MEKQDQVVSFMRLVGENQDPVRQDLIERVRKKISAGRYLTADKFEEVLEKLLADCKSR